MNTRIAKLSFTAPVHFGEGRLSDSASGCAADTFFSALYIEALHLGCADALLAAVREGELLISDLFPYIEKTLYLPRPMLAGARKDADAQIAQSSAVKKAYKNLAYIPLEMYEAYFNGEIDPVFEKENLSGLGTSELRTKVNLLRASSDDAEPYHVGSYSFADDAGLYVILRGSYDIAELLNSLQYSGIGGKRSSGCGRFSFEICEDSAVSDLFEADSSELSLLLSIASPRETELNDALLAGASYRLIRRSGFIQSETYADVLQKKRDFYSFAAGSVFQKPFAGDVFDVSAGGAHPVYRYAKAMWIEVRR
jgi:CRISPR-associated protein Csm4